MGRFVDQCLIALAVLEAIMAKGADVLVHEAMYVPAIETYIRGEIAKRRPIKFEDLMAHMNADHTPVEDVGRIAQEAGVKTLALSHLIPAFDGIDDDTWRAAAAKYFRGEIIVGKEFILVAQSSCTRGVVAIEINFRNWEKRATIHARDAASNYMLDRCRAVKMRSTSKPRCGVRR